MKNLMHKRGPPKIRVVDCADHYMAIEGSHRIAAATELGLVPELIVLAKTDPVDLDTTDIGELFPPGSKIVTGAQIVATCKSHHNPIFSINPDGTLIRPVARKEEE